MKKLLTFVFSLCILHAFSQTGFTIYPMNNMVGLRWNPVKVTHDSSGSHLLTNERLRIEVRSSFSLSHSGRGTNLTAGPEAGLFTRIAGKDGEPILFTGIGFVLGVAHNGITSGGFFLPLGMEYKPVIGHSQHLLLNAEADAMFSMNGTRQNAKFRPALCVGWIF